MARPEGWNECHETMELDRVSCFEISACCIHTSTWSNLESFVLEENDESNQIDSLRMSESRILFESKFSFKSKSEI